MVSPLRIIVLLGMMLITPLSWAVNMEVTLDADEIAAGDTVNLTVTVDEQAFGSAPDFSVLKKDFEILSNRQASQYITNNGKITSISSWILTLLPKQEGFVAIPPLKYGDQISKPIKLHVTKRRQVSSANSNELIFMDAQVDKTSVYVQEQVIYTVRLYRRIDLHESSYSPPKVANAVMEPLGNQREYTSTVDGRSYQIIELRYAVFPQKSGALEIPPAEIVATVFMGGGRGFMFDPFNGKQVRRASPAVTVQVKPQPDSFPADKPWLPARSLQLRESWKPDVNEIKAGEPVTRKIIMEAEGLAQSVLPPITVPTLNGVKIYPEQADTQSNIGPRGMLSSRTENLAIIATEAGDITLPPVEVTWWDVDEDKVKVATLPARKVHITGAIRQAQTDAQPKAPVASPATEESAPQSLAPVQSNRTWQWIALVALILWVSTLAAFGLLYRNRKRAVTDAPEASEAPRFNKAAQKKARAELQAACAANNPKASRACVIELYRQHFQTDKVHNLTDVIVLTPDRELAQSLQELDAALYKPKQTQWHGKAFATKIDQALAKQAKESMQPTSKLAPLFPT